MRQSTLVIIGSLLVSPVAGVVGGSRLSAQTGEEVFRRACQECHGLPDPSMKASEAEWQETLKRMAENARLSKEEREKVLNYLVSHLKEKTTDTALRAQAELFQAKCTKCHTPTRIFLEPLTPEGREHIVFRMREKDPEWISKQEAQQIAAFLQRLNPDTIIVKLPKVSGSTARAVFEGRCSACHTLERIYLKAATVEDWSHIVHRMHEKAPQWISDQEADQIIQYLDRTMGNGTVISPEEIPNNQDTVTETVSPSPVERSIAERPKEQAVAPAKSPSLELGRTLFQEKRCNACHAINGEGGTLAPDLGDVGRQLDTASIRRQILEPPQSEGPIQMPRIPLTPEELDALVVYLSSLRGNPS